MKKTKRFLFSALFFVFALSSVALAQSMSQTLPAPGEAPAGSPVDRYGYLSISGNKMRGSKSGATDVQLRGMSFFWGNAGEGAGWSFYNEGTVAWMVHDWKVDVLRAAVGVFNETGQSGGGGNPGYLDGAADQQWGLLKTVVEASIRRGIYVIIDWHTHQAENNTNGARDFFIRAAKEWGEYPNIIYEVYNEPINQSWSQILTYSNTVITGIRTQEAANARSKHNNVVIVGTPGWSSFGGHSSDQTSTISSSPITAGSGANIAYCMHFYANTSGHDTYRARVTSMLNANRAVFVSEWGTSAANGSGGINTTNSTTWLDHLDAAKVSWVNWSITNKDESSAAIRNAVTSKTGGWSTSDLTPSGVYVRERLRAANGTSIPTYTITTANSEGGSITRSPAGPSYNYGQQVTLTATPQAGFEFANWTRDLTGGGNGTFTVTINGLNLNIGASFYRGGLIRNGRFTSGFTTNPVTWAHVVSPVAMGEAATPAVSDGELKTNITNQSSAADHFYFWQNNIALEGGKGYRLSFRAKADAPRRIAVAVANTSARTTRYMPTREITLTTDWKDYTVDFVVNATGAAASRLEFWYGRGTSNWNITNISLFEGAYQAGGGDGREFNTANISCWDDGSPVSCGTQVSAMRYAPTAAKTAWSVVRTGSGLQLSGPDMSGTAKVSLYDVRGRMVKTVSLSNGKPFMLNKAVAPAGNYLLVVRNNQGKEVYKTRVLLAK